MRRTFLAWPALFLLCSACQGGCKPEAPASKSNLKSATDVFWALDKEGYVVAKEKPQPSRHGCKPSEYLAKKDDALFRISVFHCGDTDQARAVVEHPKTRHVDSLLRNHGEGGVLQRGPLEIIVRMTQGKPKAAEALLKFLEGL
jgi:hypothetical protein